MDVTEKKILIVDDEEAILMSLKFLLQKKYKNIVTAINGADALNIFKVQNDVSCILSDIKMPVMDGICFIKEIRKLDKEVPFIFFTSFGTEKFMMEALKYGAFDFIKKPGLENLERIVDQALDNTNIDSEDDVFVSSYKKMLEERKL